MPVEEVCSVLLITGRSALLSGISDRLEVDVKAQLQHLGVSAVSVHMAEGVDWPPSAAWSGVTAWLRSQDSLSKAPADKQSIESSIQQKLFTARDYAEKGPSILSRSRLNAIKR